MPDHVDRRSNGPSDTSNEHGPHRPQLAAPALRFDLHAELAELRRRPGYESSGPTGRTLLKEPDLRIVLIALRPGGRLEEHQASGPISIQVLEGLVRVRFEGRGEELGPGRLLTLQAGIRHEVEALDESGFLLTIGQTTYHTHFGEHHPLET